MTLQTVQTLFGPNPWAAELLALLTPFVPPVLVATAVYVNANANDTERPVAWTVGALLAGVGNFGWGSLMVGLLYHAVGE